MKALVIEQPGRAHVVDCDPPEPQRGEVLLRIGSVGFCGSDLNTFRGLNPLVKYPRIPGHEIGATIVHLGPDVADWQVGQEVLVMPYTSCGDCPACRQGRTNTCCRNQTLGVQRDGAMRELFAAPSHTLLAAPQLSLRELALVEPLTVGFHAVKRGRVSPQQTVAVLGTGMIGLGVVAGAVSRAARVIAVDVDDRKLELARTCGANETVNSQTESLHDRLLELTAGDGPDVVVEAIGLPSTFRAAVEEVCVAGRVVYIGYAKAPVEYDSKQFVAKELDILGSRNVLPADFTDVIGLLENGLFPTDQVVSHSVPIDDAAGMLAEWSTQPTDFTKIHVTF